MGINSNKENELSNKEMDKTKEESLVGEKDSKGFFSKNIENKKIDELTESLKRLQAEFENYQKRSIKQNSEFVLFANAKLMEDLLPVLDSLEQGMNHNKDLVLVHEQLIGVLKKKGLEKIIVKKGDKFDHDEMECLIQETDESIPNDSVANILMNGYKLNGKILRTVKVSVNELQKENSNSKNDFFEGKKEECVKEEKTNGEMKKEGE